jgi:hypothetical protein
MAVKRLQLGQSKCPPGVLCMSSSVVIMLVLAIIVGIGFLVIFTRGNPMMNAMHSAQPMQKMRHMQHMNELQEMQEAQNLPVIQPRIQLDIRTQGGDSRYDMAPQPLRDLVPQLEYPPRGGQLPIPVGIPTRGLPEQFQSMGVVKLPDGNVLPLYGRRTATSSDKWNYYTRTDTYNPVPLPLNFKNRDCMDSPGCNEVMDGDKVTSINGQSGDVTLYKYNGPTYIPGLL